MGLHYCLKKIKKCDPKRLQVTRHARHDKTFPCCYFPQRDTKTTWLNLALDGGESVCGDAVLLRLIRRVPALTH